MTMIERMARVICKAKQGNPDLCVMGSGSMSADGRGESTCHRRAWQDYEGAARAALLEMREPEIEMIGAFWRQKNAGTQEPGEIGDDTSDYAAWRAAIDAALQQNPA